MEAPLAAAADKLWLTLDEQLGYPTEWMPGGRLWVALEENGWRELKDLCRPGMPPAFPCS